MSEDIEELIQQVGKTRSEAQRRIPTDARCNALQDEIIQLKSIILAAYYLQDPHDIKRLIRATLIKIGLLDSEE